VVQKADMESKGVMMPSVGMFALAAVGGLAVGLGASVYKRSRRNTRPSVTPSSLEEGALLEDVEVPIE